jgi:hypothetical protein
MLKALSSIIESHGLVSAAFLIVCYLLIKGHISAEIKFLINPKTKKPKD